MKGNPNLEDFDTSLRRMYYDTNLYNKEALDYCFQICGPDRVMFGTENPGSGTAIHPETGKQTDDLAPVIDEIEWLSAEDKKNIFEDNARRVFTKGKF